MRNILLPVGRMIGGNLYQAYPRTDAFGKPIIGKDGQPSSTFSIGVAIQKGHEQHWNQTQWGQDIWAEGATAFAREHAAPTFAWKIQDGDSRIPNKRGNIPAEQEGYPGHWVLWLSQSWAPKICDAKGVNEITEKDAVKPGYYVQAYISVAGNALGRLGSPGVYLNPVAIALAGYGPEIIRASSVDTTAVGFGNSALPQGASTIPVAQAHPAPLQQFTQVPQQPVMTPAAGGATYAQLIGAGWTDDLLRQHGLML